MAGPNLFPSVWEAPRRRSAPKSLAFEYQFQHRQAQDILDFIEILPGRRLEAADSYLNHCRPVLVVSDSRLPLAAHYRFSRWLHQHCPERRQLLASFGVRPDSDSARRGEAIVDLLAASGIRPEAGLASRRPVDALALGDGALALLQAANSDPDRFNGLIMVDPPPGLIPESLLHPTSRRRRLDDYYQQARLRLGSGGSPPEIDDDSPEAKQMMLRSLAGQAVVELPLRRWRRRRAGLDLARLVTRPGFDKQPAAPESIAVDRILDSLQAQGLITAVH